MNVHRSLLGLRHLLGCHCSRSHLLLLLLLGGHLERGSNWCRDLLDLGRIAHGLGVLVGRAWTTSCLRGKASRTRTHHPGCRWGLLGRGLLRRRSLLPTCDWPCAAQGSPLWLCCQRRAWLPLVGQ